MSAESLEEYKARIARSGGHGRAAKLTKKQLSESAKKAAEARWAKTDKALDAAGKTVERIDAGITKLKKANRARTRKAKQKKEKQSA